MVLWSNNKLVRVVEGSVAGNTDLKQLELTAMRATPKDWSGNRYKAHIIDVSLDHYNTFIKYHAFAQDKDVNKLFSRRKAIWLGYKKIADDMGVNTKKWTYNPGQKRLV